MVAPTADPPYPDLIHAPKHETFDLAARTNTDPKGIVRAVDGTLHAFYTGQNPARTGPDGRPLQLVLHATSSDGMRSWQPHPADTFGATPGY